MSRHLSFTHLAPLFAGVVLTLSPSIVSAQSLTFAGAQSNLPVPGLNSPSGIAVDAAGDVFFTDSSLQTVNELPAGSTTVVAIGGGYPWSSPTGIAVDAAGDVFVANAGSGQIIEVPAGNGTPVALSTTFSYPVSVAVDATGDVFVGDAGVSAVVELPANNAAAVQIAPGTWSAPYGLALDAQANLFVADLGNSTVTELPVGYTTTQQIAAGTWQYPGSVAVDPAGDVFVGDSGLQEVLEVQVGNGSLVEVGSGLASPAGLALDKAGHVFVADSTNALLVEIQLGAVNFGSANICPAGASTPAPCSQSLTLNYNVTTAGTLGSAVVSPKDFVDAGGDTCTGAVSSGQCTVNVTFAPVFAGQRPGAVKVVDSNNNVLISTLIYGLATGPQVAFEGGKQTTLGFSGLADPTGVAVDAAGDVFVADTTNNQVLELPAGGSQTTIGSGLQSPFGVAVDALGNVYIADTNNNRVVVVAPGGSQTTVGTGFTTPDAVAVDALGNVFVADSGNNRIVEILANGSQISLPFTGLSSPSGVAVDAAGDVFVADQNNHQVLELPAGSTTQTIIGGGFSRTTGVAVDAAGDVFVADYDNNRIVEIPAGGTQFVIARSTSPALGPQGVAVDAAGDVFIGASTIPSVLEILSTAPSFAFATTNAGSTSTDSPKSALVQNIGNAPLAVAGLTVTGSGFTQVAGSGTPADCTSSTTLAGGALCNISISFTPQNAGSFTGSAAITDNTLNANPPATQNIALSGTGQNITVATSTSVTAVPTTAPYGNTVTLTATVSGASTPSGSVSFTYNGTTLGTVALNGSGVATLTTSALPVGVDTVTASYAGALVGNTSYSASSNTVNVTINASSPSHLQVISLEPSAGSGSTQTFTGVYYDPATSTDLVDVQMVFNTTNSYTNSCTVLYYPNSNALYLNGTSGGVVGPIAPGSQRQLTNSQCMLSGAATSVSLSGDQKTLTVNFAITFSNTFTGLQNVYLTGKTQSGSNTGGVKKGTWTPMGAAVTLTPTTLNFGTETRNVTSAAQTLTLTNSGSNSVTISSIGLGDADPGDFLETNNCGTLLAAASSCTIQVTFTPTTTGTRTAAVVVSDSDSSSPQSTTVTGVGVSPVQVKVVSLTPTSGTGSTQVFTATYSDSSGYTDISNANLLLNTTNSYSGACFVSYYPKTNSLYLSKDSGGLMGPITPGTAATLSNNECTLSGAGSTVTTSGNTLTVGYNLTFSGTFTGQQNVYVSAKSVSGINTGGVLEGNFTP